MYSRFSDRNKLWDLCLGIIRSPSHGRAQPPHHVQQKHVYLCAPCTSIYCNDSDIIPPLDQLHSLYKPTQITCQPKCSQHVVFFLLFLRSSLLTLVAPLAWHSKPTQETYTKSYSPLQVSPTRLPVLDLPSSQPYVGLWYTFFLALLPFSTLNLIRLSKFLLPPIPGPMPLAVDLHSLFKKTWTWSSSLILTRTQTRSLGEW